MAYARLQGLGTLPGDYYASDGSHLGSDGKKDKKTYVASGKKVTDVKDDKGIVKETKTEFLNPRELPIDHDMFQKQAATVYGESSAYKGKSQELKEEMFAIASVHQNNKKVYGDRSDQAGIFLRTGIDKRNGTKMQIANAAVINALSNGFDYSYGATMWDGQEQGLFSDVDKRFRDNVKSWEIHKNTLGWTITNEHFSKWKSNIGKRFIAPQESYTPAGQGNFNKYYLPNVIRLKSTAVYGGTIFWKELIGKEIIKRK